MIRIFFDLFIVYLFCSIVGFGSYVLIVPTYLRTPYLSMLLPSSMGLAVVSVVGAYLLKNAMPMTEVLSLSAVIGVATLLLHVLVEYKVRGKEGRLLRALTAWAQRAKPLFTSRRSLIFLLTLAIVLLPVLRANMPTTPYRVGIDQAEYAESAQYLVEHGSVITVRATLLRRLQTRDFLKAKAQNAKVLNIGTYVDSEFLLKALRWGFPAVVASLAILTRSTHVFEIEFILLVFNYALLMALVYFVLRKSFNLSSGHSLALSCAFGLNCNVLNVYYEGQLAQIFVFPYFVLALILYQAVRQHSAKLDRTTIFEMARPTALFAFLLATLFCAYNESIVLLFGVLFAIIVLDIVFYARTTLLGALFLVASILLGSCAAWPVSKQWLLYSFANLPGLARAGFWQPHWGSFAEILGLLNMYGDLHYVLVSRTVLNVALNVALSVLLALTLFAYVSLRRRLDRSLWLASPLTIGAAYVQMHSLNPILNYPYMKVYTMLLPLTFCAVFGGLALAASGRFARLRYVSYFSVAAIAASGIYYLAQYMVQGSYVSHDMLALYRSEAPRRFDRYALIVPKLGSTVSAVQSLMLVPIISMNWLNEDQTPRVIAPYVNSPVALLLSSEMLPCRICFVHQYQHQIKYENDSFVLYDTGLTVAQLCVPQAKRYSLEALGYKPLDKWLDLPSEQCDYGRFDALQRPWAS